MTLSSAENVALFSQDAAEAAPMFSSSPPSDSIGTWDTAPGWGPVVDCLVAGQDAGRQGTLTPLSRSWTSASATPPTAPTPLADGPGFRVLLYGYTKLGDLFSVAGCTAAYAANFPWAVTTAGSAPFQAAQSEKPRGRPCYHCYLPGHLVTCCPLLGYVPEAERRGLLQRRAEHLARPTRGPRLPGGRQVRQTTGVWLQPRRASDNSRQFPPVPSSVPLLLAETPVGNPSMALLQAKPWTDGPRRRLRLDVPPNVDYIHNEAVESTPAEPSVNE